MVEDELTGVPFDPAAWKTHDRMYPPQEDNRFAVPGRPDVARYRSRSHNTYIAENGAIEIWSVSGELLFRKAGADGDYIWP
jgi:hypothetical protein